MYLLSLLCTPHARLIPYKLFRDIKLIFRYLCPVWTRKQLFLKPCRGVKNSLSCAVAENSSWAKPSSIVNLQSCSEKAIFSGIALVYSCTIWGTKWYLIKDYGFQVFTHKKLTTGLSMYHFSGICWCHSDFVWVVSL